MRKSLFMLGFIVLISAGLAYKSHAGFSGVTSDSSRISGQKVGIDDAPNARHIDLDDKFTLTLPDDGSKLALKAGNYCWAYGGLHNIGGRVGVENVSVGDALLGETTDWKYTYADAGDSIVYNATHKVHPIHMSGVSNSERALRNTLNVVKAAKKADVVVVAPATQPAK